MELDPAEIYDQEYDYYQDDEAAPSAPSHQHQQWTGSQHQNTSHNGWNHSSGHTKTSQQSGGRQLDDDHGNNQRTKSSSSRQGYRSYGEGKGYDAGLRPGQTGKGPGLGLDGTEDRLGVPGLRSTARNGDGTAPSTSPNGNNARQLTPNTEDKGADLSDLKARVIASMQRTRAENSHTPQAEKRPGQAGTESLKLNSQDSMIDLDGLLAEGKAAADANYKNSTHKAGVRPAFPTRETDPKLAHNGGPKERTTIEPNKTHKARQATLNGPEKDAFSDSDASGSEQGEIREDEDVKPKKAPAKSPETTRREAQRFQPAPISETKSATSRKAALESNRVPTKNTESDSSAKPAKALPPSTQKPRMIYETQPAYTENREPRAYEKRVEQDYVRGARPRKDYERDDEERSMTSRPYSQKTTTKVLTERERSPRRGYETRVEAPIYVDDDAPYQPLSRPTREARETKIIAYPEKERQVARRKPTDSEQTDLEDWLEMTGFHDLAYRKDTLRRQREMMALDLKRAELAREAQKAQEERANFGRASSVISMDPADSDYPRVSRTIRSASVFAMPPPPTPRRETYSGYAETTMTKRPSSIHISSAHSDADPTGAYVKSPVEYGVKRRYSGADEGPAEKYSRVDDRHQAMRRDEDGIEIDDDGYVHRPSLASRVNLSRPSGKSIVEKYVEPADEDDVDPTQGSRRVTSSSQSSKYATGLGSDKARGGEPSPSSGISTRSRGQNGYGRGGYSSRGAHRPSFGSQDASEEDTENGQNRFDNHHHTKYPYQSPERGRGRGRGAGARGGRWNNSQPAYGQPRYGRQDTVSDLGFGKGDSRFFVIKSYNHENVLMAQEENIWMTQERNAEIFSEAFQNCRNVIFIFSVNKSMAFQGYARMESAPGTAPIPSWAHDLLWKSSEPFRIRWITIAETRFSHVGHLKNAYNENQACLVARDGQEVEQGCAIELCHLIDEEADRGKY
ncbi:MAG: hypothetical protein M4579_004961 [Chaenotheca gracillima]|nr:MAG: hypothetical protein M4579_004961 [Chaenotheca gracillima]